MPRGKVKRSQKKELTEKGYVECGYCSEPVKSSAMRCPHCKKWYSSGKRALTAMSVLIVALCLVSVYSFYPTGEQGAYVPTDSVLMVLSASPTGLSEPTDTWITVAFSREMNQDSVQSAFSVNPDVSGVFSWNGNVMTFIPTSALNGGIRYTVTISTIATDSTGRYLDSGTYSWYFITALDEASTLRSIGTGENDFWSTAVTHPTWAANAVQTRPVLILAHTEGCVPCETMIGICGNVSTAYASDIYYYDWTSGINEPQATDCFAAYDPVPPSYVPLTTVLTRGPNSTIIWHSWEGVIDEATLSSWLDDAITYHEQYG